MKKITISFGFLMAASMLHAQSLQTAGQQLYYERYQSAETSFHTLLHQQPDNAEAWYGLTRSYLLQNESAKAADSLRLAPAGIHTQPFYEAAYGYWLLSQNKKDSAALLFSDALKQTKEKDETLLAAVAQAHIETKAGDGNYAIELTNKAIKRDKHNAAWYVLRGDAYRKLNNGSEAYKAYKQALDENATYAAASFKIGEIFLTQKNPELYLEYFNKAIAADASYAPALYQLYLYSFYHDPSKALQYYNQYAAVSDASIQNEYDLTDLYYLNKEYTKAVQKAKSIVAAEAEATKPRIYKLLGYSYAGLKDTAQAINAMQQYFAKEEDSNFIAKDFEIMANLYAATPGKEDSVAAYYEKVIGLEKDSVALYGYFKKLSDYAKNQKNYSAQAKWLGKYFAGNNKATNVDLFNWGLAHLRAEEYKMADSVFGLYTNNYPEQSFGYYWRARSNAALDKEMKDGLAVPHYQKLIEVMQKDTANTNYKKWMVEAYGYLAAYEANTQKHYPQAIGYFEKVLEVDPENSDAKRYIAILEKNNSTEGSK
jgi:tetratricopeptide (TPR) repeat protein